VPSRRSLLDEPDRLRLALSPLRRQLLQRLRTPASAAQLAAELDLPRQRIGHHLRALEAAGLVELVEERRRRGFTERLLRATADTFVVDPAVLGAAVAEGDRTAAERVIDVAAATVRDVTRMQVAAARQSRRLLTFAVECEVRLAEPADMSRFSEELAAAVADVVARFDHIGGRPYRLVALSHPAPRLEEQS